jgi:hypothetical protein
LPTIPLQLFHIVKPLVTNDGAAVVVLVVVGGNVVVLVEVDVEVDVVLVDVEVEVEVVVLVGAAVVVLVEVVVLVGGKTPQGAFGPDTCPFPEITTGVSDAHTVSVFPPPILIV